MIIKATLNSIKANKVKIGDIIEIKTSDRSSKKEKIFLMRVVRVVSDIPRCHGCSVRMDNKQRFKYQAGVYCIDCYNRRKDRQ